MNAIQTLKTKTAKAILIAVAVTGIGVGTAAFAQETTGSTPTVTKDVTKQGKMNRKQRREARRAKLKAMTPAQRAQFRAQRIDKRIARMTKKLSLSETQAKQLKTTFTSMQKEMVQARQQNSDRAAKKKAIKAIRKAYRPELAKILTQDQMDKFKAHKKNRKNRKMKRRGGKKRFAAMAKNLNLTADQQTKIKAIHQQRRTQAKALIQGAQGDRSKVKPQLKALRKASKKQVFALLTTEQQQKWKTLRQNRRKGLNKNTNAKGPF